MGLDTIDITYESLTDKGMRKINEDSYGMVVEPECISFIVCDGLGGHGKGEVASSFVVSQMQEYLHEGKNIETSIQLAQDNLILKQQNENATDSMKTTLTCLSISKGSARFAHVGDSRIYVFQKNKYVLRSQDHSVPQMLVNNGSIKEKDIRHHEDRSRLLRVMGTVWTSPKYQVVDDIKVKANTSFLLCSDGFWELIDEKDMMKTLKKASTPGQWLQEMEHIILENGKNTNMDNYTAIAVFVR